MLIKHGYSVIPKHEGEEPDGEPGEPLQPGASAITNF